MIISQKAGLDSNGAIWLGTDPKDVKLLTSLGSSTAALQSETVITDDQWHHIGLVWDGTHRSLYVDNQEVARDKDKFDSIDIACDGGLHLGVASHLVAGSFWEGSIDDIKLFDQALGAERL